MSEPDINVNLFNPRRLKRIVGDIRNDPRPSSVELSRMDRKWAVLMARYRAIEEMLRPMVDAYDKDRKKRDPKYDPADDPVLSNLLKVALTEMDRIMDEVDKIAAVKKRIEVADRAKASLFELGEEFVRLVNLCRVPDDPPTAEA